MGWGNWSIPARDEITSLTDLAVAQGIGVPGQAGFGVGVCPPDRMPYGFTPMPGYNLPGSDNYGNYEYADGSIMCFIPAYYYKIGTGSNGLAVNITDVKPIFSYPSRSAAESAGYTLARAFIDGGCILSGFFVDKYVASKSAMGTGFVASSIKNGLPLSTSSSHNPIADLTACSTNNHYQVINACHARDGENGEINTASIFHARSVFQIVALARLHQAHAQASTGTSACAWYDATGAKNYVKGCNNNALADTDDTSVTYVSDGYSNCGKTGSGTPIAKTTHNGQVCGVCDLNGLMREVSLGVTCVATTKAIEGMAQASPCVLTVTGHGLTTGAYVRTGSITQADWAAASDKLWQVTVVDLDTLSIAFDASAIAVAYDPATDAGTVTYGTFYVAKESTSMADFTPGNTDSADHWGAAGVAAMMDPFAPVFVSGGAFAQRVGSGTNQVFSESISGAGYVRTSIGMPMAGGADGTGTNLFGRDYFYQYVVNECCLVSCGGWNYGSDAGVWYSNWVNSRSSSGDSVGFRAACPVTL